MPPAGQRKKYNGSGAKVVTQLEVAGPDEAEGWERKQDFQDVEGGHWGGGERQKDDRQQHCSSSCAFRDTHHTPPGPPKPAQKRRHQEGFAALSACMAWLKTANVCFAQLTGVGVDVTIQSHRQVWRRVVQRPDDATKAQRHQRRLTQIHNCVLLSSHSCIH
ncbi:hypothetical protein VCV18_008284 [Metarhizium anisopliae]